MFDEGTRPGNDEEPKEILVEASLGSFCLSPSQGLAKAAGRAHNASQALCRERTHFHCSTQTGMQMCNFSHAEIKSRVFLGNACLKL